jgi:hypothetical protein
MAEKYWPGRNPIGKTVQIENGHRVATVVGVVADGKYVDIDEPPKAFMYFDLNQHYQSAVYLLVRTKGAARLWLAPAIGSVTEGRPWPFLYDIDDRRLARLRALRPQDHPVLHRRVWGLGLCAVNGGPLRRGFLLRQRAKKRAGHPSRPGRKPSRFVEHDFAANERRYSHRSFFWASSVE